MNHKNIKFIFLLAASLFIMDAAFARYLLWHFPNETAWGAAPHYNFEYRLRRLKRERDPEEFMILIVGSSIAEYSVHEDYLRDLLNTEKFRKLLPESKKKIGVYILAHQGQNSMNLLSTADRVLDLEPDLVVHPVNMIDFRLERPLVLGNMSDLDGGGEKRKKALEKFAGAVIHSDEFRMLGPYGTLKHFYNYLTFDEKIKCIMSLLFATYRYRDIAEIPFERFYNNRFGSSHSYHFYSGMRVEGGGVNQNGHAGTDIEIVWNEVLEKNGFEIQSYPRISQEGPVTLKYFPRCDRSAGRQIFLSPGWQSLRFPGVKPGDRLCMEIRPGYHSDFFADTLGGRLADNAGTGPVEHPSTRDMRREDDLYKNYSSGEYEKSFRMRVMRFDEAGMAYLHYIMLSKQEMAKRKFDPEYPVFQAYSEWKRVISEEVPLVIVNSPENPINLAWYGNSDWYRGYLNFLYCGAEEGCGMYDASSRYPEQMFYDYHHMSWYGAREFTEFLAGAIMKSYPDLRLKFKKGGR